MKILLSASLVFLLLCNCSPKRIKVFSKIENDKNNYTLFFIQIDSAASGQSNQQYTYPFYIDNQKIIKQISKDWIFKIKDIPDHKNVCCKILLYDSDEVVQELWLDSKYKTAIWEDELLYFNPTQLEKLKPEFKGLNNLKLIFKDAEEARTFNRQLKNLQVPYFLKSKGSKYRLKYNGKYNLRRLSKGLKPERNIYKVREKIKKDFPVKNFELIDYKFSSNEDTLDVQIAADSLFVQHIPKNYFYIGEFEKHSSISMEIIFKDADAVNQILN